MSDRFVLAPRPQRDIDDIWVYTFTRWDSNQADLYIRQLGRHMKALASRRILGRPCPEIRPGYFKYPSGAHVIFYRATEGGIGIVRILHASMDVQQHV